MNYDEFWNLIERSRPKRDDCARHATRLTELLSKLPPEEIIEFDRLFCRCEQESYRWDLWAVASLINDGCSDDGFDYFRGWLIAQGRDYFEQAMHDPERAADRAEPEEIAECEEILYAAYAAYEKVTGQELPTADYQRLPGDPVGEPWEDDNLETMYPRLWRKYGWE